MRDEYFRGQAIEVRQRGAGGRETWRKATVIVCSGRGADVRFLDSNDSRRHHILFCDLRPTIAAKLVRPPTTVATKALTAAEVDRFNAQAETTLKKEANIQSNVILSVVAQSNVDHRTRPRLSPTRKINSPIQRTQTPLATYLKNARTERGLTQSQIAKKIGVHNQYISKWELGDWRANDDTLLAYVEHFGLDLDLMLKLREESNLENLAKRASSAFSDPPAVPEKTPERASSEATYATYTPGIAEKFLPPTFPGQYVKELASPTTPVITQQHQFEFMEFCDRLETVTPVPSGKRSEWRKLAFELWVLK